MRQTAILVLATLLLSIGMVGATSPITVSSITPTQTFQNTLTTFSTTISDSATNATLTNVEWFFNNVLIANNTISGTSTTATLNYAPTSVGTFPMEVIAFDNQSNNGSVTTNIIVTQNVSNPVSFTFPITYTWNGNAYIIEQLAGQDCAGSVWTAIWNGTAYVPNTVLSPAQALQVINLYENQFQVTNLACPILIQEAQAYQPIPASTNTNTQNSNLLIMTIGVIIVGAIIYKIVSEKK